MALPVPGAFCDFGCTGTLNIGGIAMNCPAWDLPNLVKLWAEHAIRGENKLLPGAPGVRSYPTRLDVTEHDLAFFLTGTVDAFGAAHSDPWVGLQANLDLLWAFVFQPVTVGRGDRPAALTLPSGTVRLAQVQVEPIRFPNDVEDATFVEATIHLTIIGGRFA